MVQGIQWAAALSHKIQQKTLLLYSYIAICMVGTVGFTAHPFLIFTLRRRRKDKNGKGLRHFSMKVCEKVQKKGVTSYNEVADELVAELTPGDNISPIEAVSSQHGHMHYAPLSGGYCFCL